jgi:hypothetical protein
VLYILFISALCAIRHVGPSQPGAAGDAMVEGGGNWLTLPDGRIFGRSRCGERLLCDVCATQRGPVRLEVGPAFWAKRCRARQ